MLNINLKFTQPMLHSAVMTKQEIMTWYGFLLTNFPHLKHERLLWDFLLYEHDVVTSLLSIRSQT